MTVYESALFQTTSTVIATPDLVFLVDPCWLPAEIELIRHDIALIRNGRPLYLLFTHSDYDHLFGYGAFPEAHVLASTSFAQLTDARQVVEDMKTWDEKHYIRRPYELTYPQVDEIIHSDRQTLQIGETRLTFWLVSGHTNDGVFALVEVEGKKTLVTGDYLCAVEFPYIYSGHLDYLATLTLADEIVQEFHPSTLICGHGPIATEIADIEGRISEARDYIGRLRSSILNSEPFDASSLWQRYDFQRGMEASHLANLEVVRSEVRLRNRVE